MPAPLAVALTAEQLWHDVPGGSGTYIRELTAALVELGDVHVVGVAARHAEAPRGGGLPVPVAQHRLPRRALYEAWSRFRLPGLPPAARDATVIHATTWALPRRTRPLVVTVHDLAFRRAPEHFTRRGNAYFDRALDVVRREADLVVVPSAATARDCADAGIDGDRLVVVPHGVRRVDPSPSAVAAVRARIGGDRPYVLWCGTLEPRKNVSTLLDAFELVAREDPDVVLALVGPAGWGDVAAAVDSRLRSGLADRVRVIGRVDDEELHAAYAGARALCYPSLWEGFGMPVLEAMAHGVPVVTSAGTSMAEFAEGAGLLVDPRDAAAVADGMLRTLGAEHDELAAAAALRSREYTWAAAAAATVDAYRRVA